MQTNRYVTIPLDAIERLFSPYSDEADIRLHRMRLIDDEGYPCAHGIEALCVTLGANLYDNLCESGEDALAFYENLGTLYNNDEIAGAYLYLCVQYGMLDETMPEPLQWLAMDYEALATFIEVFLAYLKNYMLEDGLIDDDEVSPPGGHTVIPFNPEDNEM